MPVVTDSSQSRINSQPLEKRALLIAWGGIICSLAVSILAMSGLVRREILIPPLVLLAVAGIAQSRESLALPRNRTALVTLLFLSVALVGVPVQLHLGRMPLGLLADRCALVLAGWSLVLWASSLPANNLDGARAWQPRRSHVLLLLVATLAIAAAKHWSMVGRFAVLQDEVLYLLQSRWITAPEFGWRLEPEMLAFLRPEYTVYHAGHLATQYPPGWPALLAAFSAVGLRWWSTSLLMVAIVGFTYLLGRELHSPLIGWFAALLVALQRWVLESAHGYMSHAASVALVTAGAYLMLVGARWQHWRRVVAWIGAGLSLGIAITVRPLSGVALAAALFIWIVIQRRLTLASTAALAGSLAVGAVGPVLGLLHYNDVTTGNPLVFGYSAVHGSLHDLGFGVRGYRYFAGQVDPVSTTADPFTPLQAVVNLAQRAWEFAANVLPYFMLLPIMWLGFVYRFSFRWRFVAPFIILPAAYFFYFFTNIRFYTELVPFLAVGIALLLFHVAQQNRRVAIHALLPILILGGALNAISGRTGEHARGRAVVLGNAAMLRDTAANAGKIAVFVREPTQEAYIFRRLSLYNERGFQSNVVIARDRGAANHLLMQRLPDHVGYLATWDERSRMLRLRRVPAKGP